MNDCKCSCTSLVVVVHSLSIFLNKSLLQTLGRLLVEYLPLNYLEACKALGGFVGFVVDNPNYHPSSTYTFSRESLVDPICPPKKIVGTSLFPSSQS
jgi:hypothetical protein